MADAGDQRIGDLPAVSAGVHQDPAPHRPGDALGKGKARKAPLRRQRRKPAQGIARRDLHRRLIQPDRRALRRPDHKAVKALVRRQQIAAPSDDGKAKPLLRRKLQKRAKLCLRLRQCQPAGRPADLKGRIVGKRRSAEQADALLRCKHHQLLFHVGLLFCIVFCFSLFYHISF